jgi:purine-binding chemotaxis protein CheW
MSARDAVYQFADRVQEGAAALPAEAARVALETWVTFILGAECFAFPVDTIAEIVRVGTITRVPDAPAAVRGIVNLRGRVIPVVDLRLRLGLVPTPPGPQARVLVATLRGRSIGLLVDSVAEVVRLDPRAMEPPPADVMTTRSEYIRAVYQRSTLLILLDPEQVLLIPEVEPSHSERISS